MTPHIIDEIIDFWLGPSLERPDAAFARRDWWYTGGAAVDEEIQKRFGIAIAQACKRELTAWQATPNGAFALVLLLDQFTRNIYRHTPEAYAGDPCARDVVAHAIASGLDGGLHPVARIWLYHPFHHDERIEEQDKGLALLNAMLPTAPEHWHAYIQRSIEGWTRHRDIVARFGRFPHRNHVLGRSNTEDEVAYLTGGGKSFGQGTK